MKKLLLFLGLMSSFAGLDLYGSQNNQGGVCCIASCLLIGGVIYYATSFDKVTVYNEGEDLIYVSWEGILWDNENIVAPNHGHTIYHKWGLKDLCARIKPDSKTKKCATEKSAGFDGIKKWYIDERLRFTPDFKHDKSLSGSKDSLVDLENADNNATEFRSYDNVKQAEYVDLKKTDLRGYQENQKN